MTRISAALRLALIAAVVAATSAASAVNAPVTAASGSLYIAVGDSIAAGVGASLPRKRGYAALVDEWRRRHSQTTTLFENLAVPGETAATFRTEGQLQRLRDVAEQAIRTGNEIAIVSVTLGGNEMLALRTDGLTDRQEGLARFAGEYPAALQEIRAITGPATRIVVTTYYDLTEGDATIEHSDAWWLAQFNTVIREAAAGVDAAVADIGALFQSNISGYTHAPYDVHPTNAGHRQIAMSVWSAIGADRRPPTINVVTPSLVTRSTPTLRFDVEDDVQIAAVDATSTSARLVGPFKAENNTYVALLDFGSVPGDTTITINARDVAGNQTQLELVVTYLPNGATS